MKKDSLKKLFVLALYFIAISIIALVLEFRHLEMSLFYFGIPAFWLLFQNKKEKKKIGFGVLLYTLPLTVIIDTLAHTSSAWFETTIFPVRILGQFPIESLFWGINYNLFIISFYEYFFDKYPTKKIAKGFSKFLYIVLGLTILISFLIVLTPHLLSIPYFYSLFILLVLLLTIFWLNKMPGVYLKASFTSLLLFIPSITHEIISLKLGHWLFENGFHIGYVDLFKYVFPFEELIWLVLLPVAIIVFYEMFIDNRK